MTPELYWLTLTVLMTASMSLPYVFNRIIVRGVMPAVMDTSAETGATPTLWAQRAIRAHLNAVENLVIFAPAVFIAHLMDISTPSTQMAAMVYFFARLAHFVVYTFGIPVLRTVTFLIGLAAQMVILVTILSVINIRVRA